MRFRGETSRCVKAPVVPGDLVKRKLLKSLFTPSLGNVFDPTGGSSGIFGGGGVAGVGEEGKVGALALLGLNKSKGIHIGSLERSHQEQTLDKSESAPAASPSQKSTRIKRTKLTTYSVDQGAGREEAEEVIAILVPLSLPAAVPPSSPSLIPDPSALLLASSEQVDPAVVVILGQVIHRASQAYFSEIEKLRSERDRLLADAEKQEETLERLRRYKANLSAWAQESSDLQKRWEGRIAEEQNSQKVVSLVLRRSFTKLNEAAKDIGRNVEVPMMGDDFSVTAAIGALAINLDNFPKEFSEKTKLEAQEAAQLVLATP
ncbi:hypothetical protein E2562_016009 [Oryza meyeriana var. granulata]|uniref:Uncharacterized protein n=1 Tax=Oryza meyeriana var. granulata TaxID=110450 RepID=A0A6G1EKF3_9ORYZ|nr:hypothetical protein E2562_016009 [Oryza meyeriana var. granulata]KAF0925311.1 hypothetical protein E2562_016009 [Oryza meyeriana var. granulata]KAF0925313.1 hypothetical protein E2562_016009 [Oryza meyeriana var. granulata]